MAHRLGRVVGLAALLLILLRLGRVLETPVDTPDWRLLAVAALLGGILLTWVTTRLPVIAWIVIHLLALSLLVTRVLAPETLSYGVVPGPETLEAIGDQIPYALEILRFGAPPVLAVPGLIALVAVACWALGAAWAWSVAGGWPWMGVVPALGFYLYLAVVDRFPTAWLWDLALASVAALGLVTTSQVVPPGAGRFRTQDHRPLPRWSLGPPVTTAAVLVLVALVGTAAIGSSIPSGGTIAWRSPGGEGSGTGGAGFAASRFAGLRQSIVSLSDDPVFRARIDNPPEPGTAGYWRLLTLSRFDGEQWSVGDSGFAPVEAADAGDSGDSILVRQTIQIESLRDDRLPSLFTPVGLASEESILRSGTSLGQDGTLQMNALTFDGLVYRVDSLMPVLDLGALASEDGQLTPMFSEAAAEGQFSVTPTGSGSAEPLDNVETYLQLPEIDPEVASLAREITRGSSSPLEASLLLEDFLRDFDYSTNVSTGHSSLDLAAWLTDPDSLNYRTGYCEQFATSMGVMGRLLGLPTRVVIGFTGGEMVDEIDGDVVTVVRERNAHAWTEVWLEGQGWVGFDPTPRSDGTATPLAQTVGFDPGAISLPDAEAGSGASPADQPGFAEGFGLPSADFAGPTGANNSTNWWVRMGWLLAALAALGVIPAWKMVRSRRRREQAAAGDITAAWEEITDQLVDLGAGPNSFETPVEFAEVTAPALVPLARAYSSSIYGGHNAGDALGQLESAQRWVVGKYSRPERAQALFSPRSLRSRLERTGRAN